MPSTKKKKVNLEFEKLLSAFTTFGIGGPAKFFTAVKNVEEMREALAFARKEKIPFFLLGKGSNVLFDDRGFNGLVILNKIDFCEAVNETFFVGAGYSFSLLGAQTARKGFSGLEFASGIPGSFGGAIYMNAGANGFETANVLEKVHFLNAQGEILIFSRDALHFQYRTSPFQKMQGAIIAASVVLTPQDKAREKQLEIIKYRKETQPLKEKSVGCIFRNPEGHSAGALIQKCGLKGTNRGGAFVSPVHANFIVNRGGAKAVEVLDLIQQIQEKVKEETGIALQPEICYVSFE
jgi:UDP-N-acetylmuramate dehydrogenase